MKSKPFPPDCEKSVDYPGSMSAKHDIPKTGYEVILKRDPKAKALHIIASRQPLSDLMKSFKAGDSIEPRNSNGDTPFHVAAHMGRSRDFVTFFLRNRANVNAKNNHGDTPLHLYLMNKSITRKEQLAIIYLVANSGADLELQNGLLLTPLAVAVKENIHEAIGLLVKAGARMDTLSGPENLSALHLAVTFKKNQSVQALIKNGARLDARDLDGYTPFQVACSLGYYDIARILIAAEPKP